MYTKDEIKQIAGRNIIKIDYNEPDPSRPGHQGGGRFTKEVLKTILNNPYDVIFDLYGDYAIPYYVNDTFTREDGANKPLWKYFIITSSYPLTVSEVWVYKTTGKWAIYEMEGQH